MKNFVRVWQKARSLGEDLEESYEVTQRHYDNPPLWLVGGQVLFKHALSMPFHEKTGLYALGGYLKMKFPSFREYCMDSEEEQAKDSLIGNLERIMEE